MSDPNTGDAPVRSYGEPGSTFIQWKGTQVCMDVYCLCGEGFHVDDDFTYAVKCPYCEKVLKFGTEVAVIEAPADYTGVVREVQP